MEKIKLDVVGLINSQTQSGAYTIILEDKVKKERLRIIIGLSEAQSIYIALENVKPPRPLTHDLFKMFSETFHIKITEIIITKLSDNVFFSKLICTDGQEVQEVDSRTSDAIALAIRFGCPIYATRQVMNAARSFENEENEIIRDNIETSEQPQEEESEKETASLTSLAAYSLEELHEMLKKAIADEEYERASKIRDEIKKRK